MQKVSYRSFGDGERDIILLHGWGTDGRYWEPLIPFLLDSFRVHIVDLPGYGRNEPVSEHLFKFVSSFKTTFDFQYYLCGWSLGGNLASLVCDLNREAVLGLITVACNPRFVCETDWPGIDSDQLDEMRLQITNDPESTLKKFRKWLKGKGRCQSVKLPEAIEYRLEALREGLDILAQFDFRGVFSMLRCPQLHLYSDDDPLVPKEVVNAVKTLLPNSKVTSLDSGAHIPFMYQPEKVATKLKEFCDV